MKDMDKLGGMRDRCKREGHIDIVFDGPPGETAGRFVEVEDENGRSVQRGEWIDRGDGFWALRIARRHIREDINGQ